MPHGVQAFLSTHGASLYGFHLLLLSKDLTISKLFQPCYFTMPCFPWYGPAYFFFLKVLREWFLHRKTSLLNFLPCVNLILLLFITKVLRAGRDWLNKCYPFKISSPGSSYYMCFDYAVVYKRERR